MQQVCRQRINIRCYNAAINNAIIIASSNIATTTSLLNGNIPKHKVAASTLHAGARNSQRSRHTVQTAKKKKKKNDKPSNIINRQHLLKLYSAHFSLHTQKRESRIMHK